ncbi:MAG: TolC family protein [Burkholderiales bacterium]|nr:TolC family protein [Burkholderiales bacterium]
MPSLRLFRAARAAALWLAGSLAAAAPAFASESLTLRAFLALVERHNPELLAAVQQRAIARAEVLVARAYPNPEAEFATGPWRPRGAAGANGSVETLGLAQSLELPSVREARLAAAEIGVESAEAQVQGVRLAVGYLARSAFYDLLRRQEEERLARENAELLDQIRRRILRRVEVGESPRFELVRAEAEALAAQNALSAARLRVEEARSVLRRLTGNMLAPQFEAHGALPAIPELPPLATLQPVVLGAHPAIRALVAERERARQRLAQERALRYPAPTLRVQHARDPETRQLSIGVALPLPLWNRREGPIAQAEATIDLLAAQLEAQRTQLLRELDSAWARVSIAQRQIETFEAGLLRSAEAALQVAEAAFRAGERSFLEVLDAQRTLRAVRADYNQARFDRYAAWLDIERLTARDPFRDD